MVLIGSFSLAVEWFDVLDVRFQKSLCYNRTLRAHQINSEMIHSLCQLTCKKFFTTFIVSTLLPVRSKVGIKAVSFPAGHLIQKNVQYKKRVYKNDLSYVLHSIVSKKPCQMRKDIVDHIFRLKQTPKYPVVNHSFSMLLDFRDIMPYIH
jgi:hypothetical protein